VVIGVFLAAVSCAPAPAPTSRAPTLSPARTAIVPVSPSPSAPPTLTSVSATATLASPSPMPASPAATATSKPTSTPVLTPTATPKPSPTPEPPPTPTVTSEPTDLWLGPSDLRIHPDGVSVYSGDLVSFEVYAHHGHDWAAIPVPDVDVEVWLGAPGDGTLVAQDRIAFYGARDAKAWMEWEWDTAGLEGPQFLNVVLDPRDEIKIGDENPENNVIARTVWLLPREDLPEVWAEADWLETSSECCVFHYISGTAAERDIAVLMEAADRATAYAGVRLGESLDDFKLTVFLIDRVLGHGGFADGALIISYLDRNYAGGDLDLVLRHEATHVLDRRFSEVRNTLLAEGLAVYVSGGHYMEEPLDQRVAALLALDRYVPLTELADDFYPSQHEIGYLEAAGFVSYLIDRFGWEAFKAAYADIQPNEQGQAAMLDSALQENLGLTLLQAESDWLAALESLPQPVAQIENLRLTIDFYDTLRRYQREWDPSAYFREAWLPPLEEAERLGVTADFVRHPSTLVNVALETMLSVTESYIEEGDYQEAEKLLNVTGMVLDAGGDLSVEPLAARYFAIVQAIDAAGYEAQRIELDLGSSLASVLATSRHSADTVELSLAMVADGWHIIAWGN
jgi:hypothetical protein